MNYWESLSELYLYSPERRRGRYAVIYIGKNHGGSTFQFVDWEQCTSPHWMALHNTKYLLHPYWNKVKLFKGQMFKGQQLYKFLPSNISDLYGVEVFKSRFDRLLHEIPDQASSWQEQRKMMALANSLLQQKQYLKWQRMTSGSVSTLLKRSPITGSLHKACQFVEIAHRIHCLNIL